MIKTMVRNSLIVGGAAVAALLLGCNETSKSTPTSAPLPKSSVGQAYGHSLHSAITTAEEVREKLATQEFERRERSAAEGE
jgi:hypothetical protein